MVVGLGTGSTAAYFIDALGARLQRGELQDIRGVPTSQASAEHAQRLGIPLAPLAAVEALDLAVDGADEVDPQLNLIKGLGRALLREKIVEIHARRLVIVVDEGKLTSRLGRGPLPVEVLPFEWEAHLRWLNRLGGRAELWREPDGSPLRTDNGNYYARLWLTGPDGEPGIVDPQALALQLAQRPGIVEHGLFLNMADLVIAACSDGLRLMERAR
ncbi:MAG: ribose-5-phosphate isomerase RpiA [Chloroflexota bacterium]